MYNYCAITIGFFNVIRYHQVTKRLAFISGVTYLQHRATDKVERSGTFVQRIFRPRTCGFLPQHLFHSSSPACPGILLPEVRAAAANCMRPATRSGDPAAEQYPALLTSLLMGRSQVGAPLESARLRLPPCIYEPLLGTAKQPAATMSFHRNLSAWRT